MSDPARTRAAWALALALALGSRLWNALEWPILTGYDARGHVSYVLFLDLYRSIPFADQGWSYFHPPLHYGLGWLLAQAGDAYVLVRGLYLLSSAASLGTAALAAWMVRLALPQRPLLAPLVFLVIAFVPAHVYTSPMPGNEHTGAFLGTLGFALFVRNQQRAAPTLRGDVLAGLCLGLALLTKFSALLPLVSALAALLLAACRESAAGALLRAARRGAVLAAVAVVVCAPYYARNLAFFGTPFQLSRDLPLVAKIEDEQPPGERGGRDLLNLSPRLLTEPDVQAPHLLHSIWGSLYVHAWTDTKPGAMYMARWGRFGLLWLGLLPTALVGLGFALSLVRAARDPAARVDAALVLLALANLAAFVIMAYRVPTWAMLKASYVLQLSVPFGLFLGRALDTLLRRAKPLTAVAVTGALACVGLAAAGHAPHIGRGGGGENMSMAPVHSHFGDYPAAFAMYERAIEKSMAPERRAWLTLALAGVRLLSGDAAGARDVYERLSAFPFGDYPYVERRDAPWPANRLAVATALAGDPGGARQLLDPLLKRSAEPELFNNRAALRLLAGDRAGADADLRAALERDPHLAAAHYNLARLLEVRGEREAAEGTRREARRLAHAAPRGFPYGVGDGFHLGAERFLLVADGDGVSLYRPARARAQ